MGVFVSGSFIWRSLLHNNSALLARVRVVLKLSKDNQPLWIGSGRKYKQAHLK
jgi:hypothetical protein